MTAMGGARVWSRGRLLSIDNQQLEVLPHHRLYTSPPPPLSPSCATAAWTPPHLDDRLREVATQACRTTVTRTSRTDREASVEARGVTVCAKMTVRAKMTVCKMAVCTARAITSCRRPHRVPHVAGASRASPGASYSWPAPCAPPLPPLCAKPVRDRKSTRLNSSHSGESRMPSSA